MIRALFLALLAYVAVAQNSSSSSDAGSSSSDAGSSSSSDATTTNTNTSDTGSSSSSGTTTGSSSSSAAAPATLSAVGLVTQAQKSTKLAQFVDLQLTLIAARLTGSSAAGATNGQMAPVCDTAITQSKCLSVSESRGSSLTGNLPTSITFNTTTQVYNFDGTASRRLEQDDSARPRILAASGWDLELTMSAKSDTVTTFTDGSLKAALSDSTTGVDAHFAAAKAALQSGTAITGLTISQQDLAGGDAVTLSEVTAEAANATFSSTPKTITTGGGASTSGASTMMLSAGALVGASFLMF